MLERSLVEHRFSLALQVVKSDELVNMSSPMTGHMSKFALLCQAARLLGQVLNYVTGKMASQDDVELQLDRTLHSMLAASLDVETPDQDQITFIYRYTTLYS